MTADSHVRRGRRRAALLAALAALLGAASLLPASAGAASALAAGSGGAAPALWPASPDWQRYVEAPANRDVHPVSVVSTSGQVTGAGALTHPGGGQSATLTRTAADTGPTRPRRPASRARSPSR